MSLEVIGENRVLTSDVEGRLEPRKRPRSLSGTVETYATKWAVLSSDALACPASTPAKEIGPDLCRGLMLPSDAPAYAAADPVTACTEMLALLSMVSLFCSSNSVLHTWLYLFYFSLFLGLIFCFALCC